MPHFPSLKPSKVIRILEAHGFECISQKGSHHKFILGSITVIVPFHRQDMRIGTLRNIIKQSEIDPQEFI